MAREHRNGQVVTRCDVCGAMGDEFPAGWLHARRYGAGASEGVRLDVCPGHEDPLEALLAKLPRAPGAPCAGASAAMGPRPNLHLFGEDGQGDLGGDGVSSNGGTG